MTRTLIAKRGKSKAQMDHLVGELKNAFPDAWVENGYKQLSGYMTNDEKDRHILAAAIAGRCEVIVTYNRKHFPVAATEPLGISVKHPDEFLIDLYHINPEITVHELHEQGRQ